MVAPDHFGFGRSDKPTDDEWYTIARHRAALDHLVRTLDLDDIHLVVQDWGGPIGLCTADADLGRYRRAVILNTWLHARRLRVLRGRPQLAGRGRSTPRSSGATCRPATSWPAPCAVPATTWSGVAAAFDAPFTGSASKAGARRFPVCIPFAEPELGDADPPGRGPAPTCGPGRSRST